jgi:predicted nucleotidyltransferase/predicted transcriptional regulator
VRLSEKAEESGGEQTKALYITYSDNIIINSDNMKLELRIIDLLARNRERKFTINEIAKSLKGYYSFVHKTVNKLIEEGLILKEKAGKSYMCSINLENEKTIALMQLSEIEKKNEFYDANRELKLILEDFVKLAEPVVNPISIVLFGSYSKNTATKESDIDILLICKSKAGIDKITKEVYSKFGKEINAIAMTPKEFKKQRDKALIKEIIKDHYVLYGVEKFVNLVLK